MRHVHVEKKVGKKPSSLVYISFHRPDDPRMVANVKLHHFVSKVAAKLAVNAANFQLDPLNSVGSTGGVGQIWGLPLNFETTPSHDIQSDLSPDFSVTTQPISKVWTVSKD